MSRVAILTTYDSRWAIEFQQHAADYVPLDVLLDYYRPLEDLTHSVDIVSANAPLAPLQLVVAPGLNVIPAEPRAASRGVRARRRPPHPRAAQRHEGSI